MVPSAMPWRINSSVTPSSRAAVFISSVIIPFLAASSCVIVPPVKMQNKKSPRWGLSKPNLPASFRRYDPHQVQRVGLLLSVLTPGLPQHELIIPWKQKSAKVGIIACLRTEPPEAGLPAAGYHKRRPDCVALIQTHQIKKLKHLVSTVNSIWCRGPESNRYESHDSRDFKSLASASSATPAGIYIRLS